jgi:hypothetical protein
MNSILIEVDVVDVLQATASYNVSTSKITEILNLAGIAKSVNIFFVRNFF